MLPVCSAFMKTLKKGYYIRSYDAWFKSYDAPSIRLAAILDLSKMAARRQILLRSHWFLKDYGLQYLLLKPPEILCK